MNDSITAAVPTQLDPEQWVDQHGDDLYRYALRRLRDQDAAAELVQETFLEAFRTRDAFAGRSSERTWLIAILRHRLVDHIRREQRRRRAPLGGGGDDVGASITERTFDARGHWKTGTASWKHRPDQVLEQREFWETVASCLEQLPPSLATTFWLREIDGLSGEEVCHAAEISPANLWVRLHRARLLLRDCLERHWFCDGRPATADAFRASTPLDSGIQS